MVEGRVGRALSALAVVAMAAVPLAVGAFTAPAGAAGSVTAATAAQLNTAWQDGSNTTITLTADITISGGDCVGGFVRSSGTGITVDGQGTFGIVSSCNGGRILADGTSESVTLTGLTHFDGGNICDLGGGLAADGPVTVTGSAIAGNTSGAAVCACGAGEAVACSTLASDVHAAVSGYLGGAIYSGSDVTLSNSTFSGNHADEAGGAVFALGGATVTATTFTGNSAGQSGPLEAYLTGGALVAGGAIAVDGSTFTGNWIGDAQGNLCSVCAPSGGAISDGSVGVASAGAPPSITITGSTISDNHADCDAYCLSSGGAVQGSGPVTTSGSVFTGNTVNIKNCSDGESSQCYDIGGAISSPSVTDTGSTFSDNHADAAGCSEVACWNEGGAIATGDLQLTGTTVAGNSASCDDNCASYGGGVAAGGSVNPFPDSTSAASGWSGAGLRAAVELPAGTVAITQSTFSGNTSSCDTTFCGVSGGGALFLDPVSVDISASTFDGNAAQWGGAFDVFTEGAPVSLTNSTVTGNSSSFLGAVAVDGAEASLAYDTIVGNAVVDPPPGSLTSAGARSGARWGGVHAAVPDVPPTPASLSGSSVTVFGTIVALPQGAGNCDISGPVSQGYNWSDDATCGFTDATDKVATPNDPQLNALGTWGGPTQTMLPVTPRYGGATSPVIDGIPAAACQTGVAAGITTDQRGVTRPQLVGCDIGAVEITQDDYQVEALVVTPKFTG